MPEVNLLKDTENTLAAKKKPLAPGAPELTNPASDTGSGMMGKLKSLFRRSPQTLPVMPAPAPMRAVGQSTPAKGTAGERILSEKKQAPGVMIPLPEDEGGFNVNLLSDDLVMTVSPKRRAILLGVIALAAAVAVGLAYGGLVLYQGRVQNDITETKNQLSVAEKEVGALKEAQATAAMTVQKLKAIQTLIDRHTRWTKFFALLERYTLPEVTYGPSFGGNLSGSVALTATTTSYEKVAQQYLVFQQLVRDHRFISAFTLTGATSRTTKDGKTSATFSVGLTLLPENFTMTSEEFAATTQIDASSLPGLTNPSTTDLTPPQTGVQDYAALICYFRDTPADISFMPEYMRTAIQTDIASSTISCDSATAEDKTRLASSIRTDADTDGVNLYIENLYGTKDNQADSGKGAPDAEYIKTTYLSEAANQ